MCYLLYNKLLFFLDFFILYIKKGYSYFYKIYPLNYLYIIEFILQEHKKFNFKILIKTIFLSNKKRNKILLQKAVFFYNYVLYFFNNLPKNKSYYCYIMFLIFNQFLKNWLIYKKLNWQIKIELILNFLAYYIYNIFFFCWVQSLFFLNFFLPPIKTLYIYIHWNYFYNIYLFLYPIIIEPLVRKYKKFYFKVFIKIIIFHYNKMIRIESKKFVDFCHPLLNFFLYLPINLKCHYSSNFYFLLNKLLIIWPLYKKLNKYSKKELFNVLINYLVAPYYDFIIYFCIFFLFRILLIFIYIYYIYYIYYLFYVIF